MSITALLSNKRWSSTTSFNDLPQETAAEILLRLPVKDLIRSTSVNKTWYSLINNPSFIYAQINQINHSISQCDQNAVLIIPPITSHQNYCSLISADTSSLNEKFDIPFETRSRSLRLIAQKHLDDRKGSYYFAGMGFDKVMNDYKIVRIVYVKDEKSKLFGEVAPKVEIFSLRTNTWRKLENPGVPRLVHEDGIYVNGCYYWLEIGQPGIKEARTCQANKLVIMSFDFHTELFGEFKVPHDVPHVLEELSPKKLMQFEDSLALCVVGKPLLDRVNNVPYCIWLMRQENGVVTWTLRFRALLKGLFGYPLDITKNGTLIIEAFREESTRIVSYNFKRMIFKDLGFGMHGGPEVPLAVCAPSTVDTSFPESLIMYEGGSRF